MLDALHKSSGNQLFVAKAAVKRNGRLAQTPQKGSFMF
jgi:hypothetical protein